MQRSLRWLSLVLVLALGACAHPISMAPDLGKLGAPVTAPRAGTVGLYVPADAKAKEVVSPGGGGDKVSYYPYRDLESGLFKVLGNQWERVVVVSSPRDLDTLAKAGVAVVMQPQIVTRSSSDSLLTWPPTFFEVQLTCTFSDIGGTRIAESTVTGAGKAEFSEFSSDFSLAAKRASQDALDKAQKSIAAEPRLR